MKYVHVESQYHPGGISKFVFLHNRYKREYIGQTTSTINSSPKFWEDYESSID